MCADDAQSRFLEPSTFNQKPYAAAPAVWRSSPSSAAPRLASADLVAEVVDLIGVSGYYAAVSMTLNVAQVTPPEGTPLLLK